MKTDRSLQSSINQRGFSLVETVIGLASTAMLFTVLLVIISRFYGSTQFKQNIAIMQRFELEEVASEIRNFTSDRSRTFLFEGRLLKSDGSPYAGTPLVLPDGAYAVLDEAGLLSASGMTLVPAGALDISTLLSIRNPEEPMWVVRESHTLTGGSVAITLSVSGARRSRQFRFTVPAGASAARIAAAKGSAVRDANGTVTLTLPNPLASPYASLPDVQAGSRIRFCDTVLRTAP